MNLEFFLFFVLIISISVATAYTYRKDGKKAYVPRIIFMVITLSLCYKIHLNVQSTFPSDLSEKALRKIAKARYDELFSNSGR